jgi:hypothetical protein
MITVDPERPRGIVWIASYPKSGSTWLRLFIHHLLRIRRGRPADAREIDNIGYTSPSLAGRVDLFEKHIGRRLAGADMRDIILARPKVQRDMAEEVDGILAVKTHSLLGRIADLPLFNLGVSAGAVYIVRNPLDIAVSLAPQLGKTIEATIRSMAASLNASLTTARLAAEIWGSWSENVASWTTNPPSVIKVVRYEDLLADPLSAFEAIARHMRIGATEAELAEAVRASSFEQAASEERSGGFVERPPGVARFFRAGRAGQWREALSAAEVDRIVADHGEQMRRFGYLPAA